MLYEFYLDFEKKQRKNSWGQHRFLSEPLVEMREGVLEIKAPPDDSSG